MSILDTMGVFAGIPLLIFIVISGLAYAGGGKGRSRRYRPGRPFQFTPVWYLSSGHRVEADRARELTGGVSRQELTGGETPQGTASQGVATPLGATGGASDRW